MLTELQILSINLRLKLSKIFCHTNFIEVVFQKCLDKDPVKRWSCDQLLSHPFFKNFTFKFPEHELNEFDRLRRVSRPHLFIFIHPVFNKTERLPWLTPLWLKNDNFILQNASFNGSLLPHLPSYGSGGGGGNGSSKNGSPDIRLAASNLSLGSVQGGLIGAAPGGGPTGNSKKYSQDSRNNHLPTIWHNAGMLEHLAV